MSGHACSCSEHACMREASMRWFPLVRNAHTDLIWRAAENAEALGTHVTDRHLSVVFLVDVAQDELARLERAGHVDDTLPCCTYGLMLAARRYVDQWFVMREAHDAGTCAYCAWCLYQHMLIDSLNNNLEV